MRRSVLTLAFLSCVLAAAGCAMCPASPAKGKFLVILQAGTESHEGLARAVHALLYSAELLEAGHKVVLIFDGAGTEWANALRDPKHKLHARYKKLADLGVVEEICDFCAGAFKVKGELKKIDGIPLVGTYSGHPSLVKWIDAGYTVIVL
jgi:hypothetical protein